MKAKDNIKEVRKDMLNPAEQQMQPGEQQLEAVNQRLLTEIAERKRFEEALEVLNREFRDFIHIVSHDLREPLRKISSFGILLKDSLDGNLDKENRENLSFMIDGADRMTQMIEALLVYSRINIKSIVFQTVDLNETVGQLIQFELAALIEETGAVIEIPQLLPKVQADPALVRQLFQNLIINGIKYRREGVQPHILLRTESVKGSKVRIELQDNGAGIDEKHRTNVFKMFVRLHSRQEKEGLGAGLALCKKIVDKHGGEIGIDSKIGVGSVFWFTLPEAECVKRQQYSPASCVLT